MGEEHKIIVNVIVQKQILLESYVMFQNSAPKTTPNVKMVGF